MKKIHLIICLLIGINSNFYSQELTRLNNKLELLQPENVFPNNSNKFFLFADNSGAKKQSTFTVDKKKSSNPVFTAEVFSTASSHYQVGVTWKSVKGIAKDDVILARFSMRAIYAKQESGEGNVSFFVQEPKPNYNKSVIIALASGSEWKTFDVPFVAKNNMPAGSGEICFSFGALPQKVEITNIQVLNFKQKVKVEQLPTTRFSYTGREANAAWRERALKRIEEIRTAPINIVVTDSLGNPISDVSVKAQLVKSDFIWGSAANEHMLASDSKDSEKYKAVFKELFNTGVIENGLKSPAWINNPTRQIETKAAFEWLEQAGFRQRGHNLVWPGWKFNSSDLKALAEKDSIAFKKRIEDEFRIKNNFTKGRVIAWDVVNEYMHERDFMKYLPSDIVVQWFKLAKELDPDAQLYINDYGVLNSIASPKNIQNYIDTIAHLRSLGAPIEAIGAQGHVGRQPRNPTQVISDLDIFATSGLPVQITEFDVNTPDEELQADYTRDFLIACYSHPNVTGFSIWGFWESKHWKPDAAMFRKDWTPKPNAAIWREYVTGKWKTSVDEKTNIKGEVNSRGHLGQYEIVITKEDSIVKLMYRLTKTSEPLNVVL